MENIKTQAELFQENCHFLVEKVMKDNPKISYQDATNVWLFDKLAELQIQINELNFKLRQK